MNEYLDMEIRKLIGLYPETGRILEEYGIGCVPCQAGSCKFRDILTIHRLSEEAETDLMKRIFGVIFPGKDVVIPRIGPRPAVRPGKLSPPLRMLVEEHLLIKRLIALIPRLVDRLELPRDEPALRDALGFIRNYADRFHHAKEEEILFKNFDPESEIIRTMCRDHVEGRAHVASAAAGLDRGDPGTVGSHLLAYGDLLTEHIRKEDEILYPWMDGRMTTAQVGSLYSDFLAADRRSEGVGAESTKLIASFEERYHN